MRALPAGMQLETTFGTSRGRFDSGRQQRAALRAARDGVCTRHLHRTRAKRIFPHRLFRRLLLALLAAVLVSTLPILPL